MDYLRSFTVRMQMFNRCFNEIGDTIDKYKKSAQERTLVFGYQTNIAINQTWKQTILERNKHQRMTSSIQDVVQHSHEKW